MEIKDELVKIRDSILTKDGIVSTEKQDLFREQLQRTFNNDLIRAMASNPYQRAKSISKINDGIPEDEEEDDDASAASQTDDDDAQQNNQEEEDEKDEDEDEGADDEVSDEQQIEINRTWIKGLDVNYPLKTYYKHIKKNLQIVLGSERIPTRKYPKWSENLYSTFKRLTAAVPEILFVY